MNKWIVFILFHEAVLTLQLFLSPKIINWSCTGSSLLSSILLLNIARERRSSDYNLWCPNLSGLAEIYVCSHEVLLEAVGTIESWRSGKLLQKWFRDMDSLHSILSSFSRILESSAISSECYWQTKGVRWTHNTFYESDKMRHTSYLPILYWLEFTQMTISNCKWCWKPVCLYA